MKKFDYSIVLDTELGERKGTLQLSIDKTEINGFLSVLNHTTPCLGIITDDGQCRLHGKIITLIKEIFYEAYGHISESEIVLTLRSGTNTFYLKGKAE